MIWLAAGALVALVVTVAASASLVRSLIRSQTRERAILIDQIMHLAGRTWTPPPAERLEQGFDPDAVAPERFVLSPGQLPDDDTY